MEKWTVGRLTRQPRSCGTMEAKNVSSATNTDISFAFLVTTEVAMKYIGSQT